MGTRKKGKEEREKGEEKEKRKQERGEPKREMSCLFTIIIIKIQSI